MAENLTTKQNHNIANHNIAIFTLIAAKYGCDDHKLICMNM